MTKTKADKYVYQLEKAYLDWTNSRIQMVTGMVAIFCLCLVNFFSFAKSIESVNSYSISGDMQFVHSLAISRVLSFGLYFVSCFLVALITLELTGRFGNRVGASSAIWSALLFCISPWQIDLCLPIKTAEIGIRFLCLLAIFLLLRADMARLVILIVVISLCLELGAYLFVYHIFNEICIRSMENIYLFFFPTYKTNVDLPLGYYSYHFLNGLPNATYSNAVLFLGYLMTGLVCLLRLSWRNLTLKAGQMIGICLIVTVVLANLPILYRCMDQKYWIFIESAMRLNYAALAMTLSLACLPAIDKGRVGSNYVIGFFGLATLVIFSIAFEILFTSFLSYQR